MIPPIESIQYLVDVFIEGGYAEEEDLDHLDAIHMWLRDEEKARDAAFQRRIVRNVSEPGWVVEPHDFDNPAEMIVNRDGEDGPLDPENSDESRATYIIRDMAGNRYFFTE